MSDGTNIATNSYLANSSLVGQIMFKSNTVTRGRISMGSC
jgi:hypothetical protein